MELFLGIDLGTSGCRAIAIDRAGKIIDEAAVPLPAPLRDGRQVTQDPELWWHAVRQCLLAIAGKLPAERIRALAVAGTSGSLLLGDGHGDPLAPALMYNDARAIAEAARIRQLAPPASGAHGPHSGLAKLLWLQGHGPAEAAVFALHQTDWICGRLCGCWGVSDYNNALKLGFDPVALRWPDWLTDLGVRTGLLPEVCAPGTVIGTVRPEIAQPLGLPGGVRMVAGTTDGVAAFLAADGKQPGGGVTSLGSTLVLKLLSTRPVFSPEHGVYSHRLGNLWLAGGASNSGGAVLRKYFSVADMKRLTPALDPDHPTGLDYYPLAAVGERFPVCDPALKPRLSPPANSPLEFFQALLEGISRIEAAGYRLLTRLGGPELVAVRTTGGGSHNPAWVRIRERALGVPVKSARSEHPAYGAALLAAGQLGTTGTR